ncbi:MAG: putative glycoside hydrolase [Clostridiaceae bacterium]|nr:putative glycoside hydrolase [Clostridiaceae bacterium]
MPYRSYRGGPRNLGKIAGMIVGGFLIVVVIVGWILIQDAIVFTADGMRFEPESLFGAAATAEDGGTAEVTLPPATTAVTISAEYDRFEPKAAASLDVEDAELPPVGDTYGVCGRVLTSSALAAADFASTARLLAASGETMAVIDLKYPSGRLGYQSASSLASRAGANAAATEDFYLRDAVAALRENGITVIGRISALSDTRLAETDETLALRDANGNTLKDSEGNLLLDPSIAAVREYLTAIATEAAVIGFDGIVLDNCWLPVTADADPLTLEAAVKGIDNVLGSRTLGLMLPSDESMVQPDILYEHTDTLWAAKDSSGIRYLIDEAGRLIDTH